MRRLDRDAVRKMVGERAMTDSGRRLNDGRIGYVLKVFPRVSETFVINEILALESFGRSVTVYALHHPKVEVAHGILRRLEAPVRYVEDVDVREEEATTARRVLARTFGIPKDERQRYLPRKYVRLAVGLAKLAREDGVGHLHAHFASRSGHVAALAACLIDRGYSITAHAKDIYHADVDTDVLRWKIEHAEFFATVTEYNRTHLQELLGHGSTAVRKVVRVYNGVDLARFEPKEPAKAAPPLLLGIGRLVEKKGFRVLIDACRLLQDRGVEFRCEIIGGGDLEGRLREQIQSLGLENVVRLTGSLTTEEVSRRLRDARVVVLPCVVGEDGNIDALPTVLLEAMASGRALVSTRLSGIPEIVEHGANGLLVEPGDGDGLADALAWMVEHPQRAAEMGRVGRRMAEERFDLYKNAARVLHHILDGTRTAADA